MSQDAILKALTPNLESISTASLSNGVDINSILFFTQIFLRSS